MISIILGHKGSGKTKSLISCVNKAIETSKGNVVCVEKEKELSFIQNGRFIGAVTHVFLEDSTSGYGIFAENMLETSQNLLSNQLNKAS